MDYDIAFILLMFFIAAVILVFTAGYGLVNLLFWIVKFIKKKHLN